MSIIHLRLLGGAYLSAQENGCERLIAMPPKPTALLAYLAVAGADGRALRRDTLLALFWPELPDVRARAALRQVLFRVRRILGPGALRADRGSVALAPGALLCDVIAFEGHLAAGNPVAALELYRGELLAGFYVDGMSRELEAWIEGERARLNRRAFEASWSAAEEAERSHDAGAAATWARRVVALVPDDEIAARRYIELLDRCGDRAGALRAADELARRMEEEFGSEPSAETLAVVAAIRNRRAESGVSNAAEPAGSSAPTVVPPATPVHPQADLATPVPPESRAGEAAILPVRRPQWWPWPMRGSALPAAAVLAMLLALVGGAPLAPRGMRAARSITGLMAASAPAVTIASPVARRLYEEGLDRYYAGDEREAARLLHAAVAEDGSCAMCAYYASLADAQFDDTASVHMLRLAMRRARAVSQPERMLIRFGWADATNSPSRLAVADSLAMRYETWPEAQLAVGEALWMEGQYLDATPHLRLAISADSRGTTAASGDCPACTAEFLLVNAYKAADSMAAAVRAARAWVRTSPRSRSAWLELANALAGSGSYAEARAALDSSTAYAAGQRDDPIGRAQIEIRAGNFSEADDLLKTLALTGQANSRVDAFWWLVISLREQGRLREALALARGPLQSAEIASTLGPGAAPVAQGQLLFELGRFREAAATFEAYARADAREASDSSGALARRRAWFLTQAGSALAAAGDTDRLAALADTVQVWGRESGLGRDRHLYEYLRGLLFVARRRPTDAVVAFRRAMVSPTEGFSRLDLELANTLLELDRPMEAVPLLRSALSGSLEGGNFYATRTELQELLARAYDAAAEPDSAAAYYGRVLRAWRAADPRLGPRVANARAHIVVERQHLASRN